MALVTTASEARVTELLQGRKGAEASVVREGEGRGGIMLELDIAGRVLCVMGVEQLSLRGRVQDAFRAGSLVRPHI